MPRPTSIRCPARPSNRVETGDSQGETFRLRSKSAVRGTNWLLDVSAAFDEVGLVVVELPATTAADVPGESAIVAVTVAHGALLKKFWAEGTISFETTKLLAAAGSVTALE